MTVSFEISQEHMDTRPPFTDACERCLDFRGSVVPYATMTQGDTLTAFYHHGRCGYEWFTNWGAQWDHTWQRIGPTGARIINHRSLPAPRQLAGGSR